MTTIPTTVQERVALPLTGMAPSAQGGPTLTAGELFAILRRRIVLIVVLAIVFSGLAVGGFFLWWFEYPSYRSEAYVECVSDRPDVKWDVEGGQLNKDEHDRFVQTQAVLLKSPRILNAVLSLATVRNTTWFQTTEQDRREKELEDTLVATPVRGTNILKVSMACRDAGDPAVIVNEVVNYWLNDIKKDRSESFRPQLEAATNERTDLENLIREKRERLAQLAQQLPGGAREEHVMNMTAQRVLQLTEQAGELRLQMTTLRQMQQALLDSQGVAITADIRLQIESDPQVQMLSQNVFLLKQQLRAQLETYGENHGAIRRMRAQIEAAEDELGSLRNELYARAQRDTREAINAAFNTLAYAWNDSIEALGVAEAELQDQDALKLRYQTLEQEIEDDRDRMIELQAAISGLARLVARRTEALEVRLAQRAEPPRERSSPSLIMLPVGVLVSIALAMGLAIGLELLDTSVRTSQDITRHLQIALLGAVPHTDDEEVSIEHVETASRDAPRSMVAEAFRRVRTNLQFSAPAARQRSVLVTSPRPEDGKTSVASNLAITLAQAGRRVLLVDANFRRPGLQKIFENVSRQGLSNILIGTGSLTEFVATTNVRLLDILGSGPIPPNPAELLGSEQFHTFLEDATSRYDHVIFDSPPVLLSSDSLVLSTMMDGVILVVRAKQNSRGAARRACNLLGAVNAHLFGAILNAAQVTRGGYYREQLRSYYDYQAEAEADEPAVPTLPETPPADR